MRFEEVTRSAVEHRDGGLHFRLANKRNWFIALFILVWLGGWTVGGSFGFRIFSADLPNEARLFTAFWMVGWALGWVAAASTVLWITMGAESVTANTAALTHTLHVGPLRYDRHYKPAELKNLMWRDGSGGPAFVQGRGTKPSAIVADYGAKSIEFLRGISQSEATNLLDKLRPALGMRRPEQ